MKTFRRENPNYGVLFSEILFEENDGSGQFVTRVDSNVLPRAAQVATVAYTDDLSIAIGIHPNAEQMVLFLRGGNVGTRQVRQVYKLPPNLDGDRPYHDFQVSLADWNITAVTLDGVTLNENREA